MSTVILGFLLALWSRRRNGNEFLGTFLFWCCAVIFNSSKIYAMSQKKFGKHCRKTIMLCLENDSVIILLYESKPWIKTVSLLILEKMAPSLVS